MTVTQIRFLVAMFFATVLVVLAVERDRLALVGAPDLTGWPSRLIAASAGDRLAKPQSPAASGHPPTGAPPTAQAASAPPTGTALSAESVETLQNISAEVMSSSDVDARIAAVQQLNGARTPDSVFALGQAALRDRDSRVRFLAVDSLRLLALNEGDADGSLRAVIRLAAADRDEEVARHARESLRELDDALAR